MSNKEIITKLELNIAQLERSFIIFNKKILILICLTKERDQPWNKITTLNMLEFISKFVINCT